MKWSYVPAYVLLVHTKGYNCFVVDFIEFPEINPTQPCIRHSDTHNDVGIRLRRTGLHPTGFLPAWATYGNGIGVRLPRAALRVVP